MGAKEDAKTTAAALETAQKQLAAELDLAIEVAAKLPADDSAAQLREDYSATIARLKARQGQLAIELAAIVEVRDG